VGHEEEVGTKEIQLSLVFWNFWTAPSVLCA